MSIKSSMNEFSDQCFRESEEAGWWPDIHDLHTNVNIVPAKLCLIHSELSEAMEGHRKNLQDDKLPNRKAIEVELADAVIRIADLCGALGLDLGGAIVDKMAYNKQRLDHKKENRELENGKKY